jgi:hypothetical protein
MDEQTKPTDRTASQLLMDCLSDFGDSEATLAIVIYKQENGDLNWRQTSNVSHSEVIGMLECIKAARLAQWLKGVESLNGGSQ